MLFFRPSRNIPPLEEIYQRERRVQHLLNRVRHGQDPRVLDPSTNNPSGQPSFADMYDGNSEATDRFRQIRDRRLARNMSRRQV